MFMGEFSHTVDSKGRLIIPAKFRDELGTGCVITLGFDNCLAIYTKEDWLKFSGKLTHKQLTKSNVRAMQRAFFGSATEVEFDKQGRILIPANLRNRAELGKEAIILGVSDRVEIWSCERYQTYQDEMFSLVEAFAENFDED